MAGHPRLSWIVSILDLFQAHDAQFPHGMIRSVGHDPVAHNQNLIFAAINVAFLQIPPRKGAAFTPSRMAASWRCPLREAMASRIAAASLNTKA
jgi:hypothetical protein